MKKTKLEKIKKVKKILIENNDYKNYKLTFKNKKTRFLFTKLSIIFESSISEKDLAIVESSLSKETTQNNFSLNLKEISKTFNLKFISLDWYSLGITIWYFFQTSLYYDKKRKIYCEFTEENYVELNVIKRKKFSKWLESFYDTKNINFNSYVKKVLEIIN